MDGWIIGGSAATLVLALLALRWRLSGPSQAARRDAAAHLRAGETLVRAGAARRVEGLRTPPGQLYLTRHRLIFVADGAAIGDGGLAIELKDVRSVETFMGVGVLPNGVCLGLGDTEHRFLVPADSHGAWTRAIGAARGAAQAR